MLLLTDDWMSPWDEICSKAEALQHFGSQSVAGVDMSNKTITEQEPISKTISLMSMLIC